ncbi:hypothetical protein D3C77_280610 [compost metagenome]
MPVIGQFTGGCQFQTVHAAFADVLVSVAADQYPGVFLLGAENRGGQGQALVQQVPLGADFVVGGFFRFQFAAGRGRQQRVAVAAFTQRSASGGRRGGIGNVDAAVFRRLPRQAQLAGDELAGVFGLEAGGATGDFGLGLGVEMVVAQAHGQQPGRIQFQGVGQVDGAGVAGGVGTRVGAADATTPCLIRVGVGERGAHARNKAFALGAVTRPEAGNVVAFLGRGFAAQLDTGREGVLEPADVHLAEQVGLVGGGAGIGDTVVRATPDFTLEDVALAVVRLTVDVILQGVAVAQGVLDGQRITQVMFQSDGGDICAALEEVAANQTVEVVTVAAISRLVGVCRRTIGGAAGFKAVRDA